MRAGFDPSQLLKQHLGTVLPGTVLSVTAQWHRVLDRGLAESAVVGVAEAVTRHLGRTPARSHITARRAAHRYAATGEAQVTVIPSVVTGSSRRVLMLAHPEIDLDTGALRLLTQVSRSSRAARVGAGRPDRACSRETARRGPHRSGRGTSGPAADPPT